MNLEEMGREELIAYATRLQSEAADRSPLDPARRAALALEGSHAGQWVSDPLTGRMTVDARWAEMLGFTVEEITPNVSFWFDLIHPDDRPAIHALMQSIDRGETPFGEAELRLRTKRGDWKWILTCGKVVERDESGRPSRVAGIHIDVTERKRAEEALKEREALLDATGRMAKVGGWELYPDSGEVVWTPEVRRIHEVDDDYRPRLSDALDFYPPEARSALEAALRRCFEEGVEFDLEFPFITAKGSRLWVRAMGRPCCDGARVVKVSGVFQDITALRSAESALKQSEERYRGLFENAPVGIMSIDTEGRILEVNPALLRVLGSPSAEATKAINMFTFPPLVKSGVSALFSSCLTSGGLAHGDAPYTSKWGVTSHLRMQLTPVLDEHGQVCGCQAVAEDVSDQKRLEEQLRHSQKMEAVGTLAGGIAHEFNNILHIIAGHAELLELELEERNLRFDELAAIRTATRRGADLVRRLLTYGRKVDATLEPINLNEEIERTTRLLSRILPQEIRIETSPDPNLKAIFADAAQLEQLLVNLALNARDAMPRGGVLRVRTENIRLGPETCNTIPELKPGDYVRLTVSDTGEGIPESIIGRVFEPFFTTKEPGKGTGLGLSIVFGIVKMHLGYMECHSASGKGAVFTIYFPAEHRAVALPNQETDVEKSLPLSGHETILVVDDEPMVRNIARRLLERAGYSVLEAGSGPEAIRVYREAQSRISLVLLDLSMPEMGGAECLEEMLRINPLVKAVIASGFAATTDIGTPAGSAFKGMTAKPFDMAALLRTVRRVIDEP